MPQPASRARPERSPRDLARAAERSRGVVMPSARSSRRRAHTPISLADAALTPCSLHRELLEGWPGGDRTSLVRWLERGTQAATRFQTAMRAHWARRAVRDRRVEVHARRNAEEARLMAEEEEAKARDAAWREKLVADAVEKKREAARQAPNKPQRRPTECTAALHLPYIAVPYTPHIQCTE